MVTKHTAKEQQTAKQKKKEKWDKVEGIQGYCKTSVRGAHSEWVPQREGRGDWDLERVKVRCRLSVLDCTFPGELEGIYKPTKKVDLHV